MATSLPTSSKHGTLYFAFGSNLSTTQMQQRCPSSARPLAIAKLNSYSWFICDRGYANVIGVPPPPPSSSFPRLGNATNNNNSDNDNDTEASVVWGIIYLLTARDEKKLDGNEGFDPVRSGGPNPDVGERYWKPFLQGDCSYNKLYLLVKIERWLVDEDELASVYGVERFDASAFVAPSPSAAAAAVSDGVNGDGRALLTDKIIRTLIYVDEVRTRPGRIMPEYIQRMSRAVMESVPLGIPETWVERTMRQHGIVWYLGQAAGSRSLPGRDFTNRHAAGASLQAIREMALVASVYDQ